jgi:hypothetical protein
MKNLRPRRHQEEQENGMGPKSCLREQMAGSLNRKDDKNEMGVLYREMEDWYRGEENHSMAGAV